MLILDTHSKDWREQVVSKTRVEPLLWDLLQRVVRIIVRAPFGALLDLSTLEAFLDMRYDWLLLLIIRHYSQIPIYIYISPATLLAFARLAICSELGLHLSDDHLASLNGSSDELASVPWVFVDSRIRLFGTLPNYEFLRGREHRRVEFNSQQRQDEQFEQFRVGSFRRHFWRPARTQKRSKNG
jgi:hypothetical protein